MKSSMASSSSSATAVAVVALASAAISGSIHGAAAASTLMQNVCGTDYNHALECGTPCPGGKNEECATGQWCFIDIDCPTTEVLKPYADTSSSSGGGGGRGGGKRNKKPKQQEEQLEQRNSDTDSDGRNGSGGRSGGTNSSRNGSDKHIIGYYASWQLYDRSQLAKPANMDFNKLTRVNFAFFQTDVDGNIWGTDVYADPLLLFGDIDQVAGGSCQAGAPNCQCSWTYPGETSCSYHIEGTGLISLVHDAGKEIYPSIGGWTLSGAFPAMSANPTSRQKFAENCRKLVEDYDFDGIDIDWEYPGYAEHMGTPADKENYSLLLHDIRQELDALGEKNDRTYGLTAALPCGTSNMNNMEIETISEYLTEFNLMTYDFHGSWDATTGVNSPLWDGPNDPEPGWSVDGCVKNWVSRGAPQDKLNIGLAFYGRSFKTAQELGVTHGGADYSNWNIDEGTPQYFNLMDKIKDMTVMWDEQSATPYAVTTGGSVGLVSFDDERSICLKTEYALSENLQGFIIWELSGDVMADLSTPLLDMVNTKLTETGTDCSDPHGPKLAPMTLPKPAAGPVASDNNDDEEVEEDNVDDEGSRVESLASSIDDMPINNDDEGSRVESLASSIADMSGNNDDEGPRVESLASSIAEISGNNDEEEEVVAVEEESMASFAATTQGGSTNVADEESQTADGGGGRGEENEVTDIRVDEDRTPSASSSETNNYDSLISSGTAIQVSSDEVEAQLINAYYDGRKKVKRDSKDTNNKPYRPEKVAVEKEF